MTVLFVNRLPLCECITLACVLVFPCVCPGDIKRQRHWQRDLSKDVRRSDQCYSLQWSRRFSVISNTLSVSYLQSNGPRPNSFFSLFNILWFCFIPIALFFSLCLSLSLSLKDLNCLTLMLNESPTKTKNSSVVSPGNTAQIVECSNIWKDSSLEWLLAHIIKIPFTLLSLNSQGSKIRTSHIKIRSLESRSFVVTLDRDSHRTYKDVQG